tara:strand:+ start:1048 stop:1344 length:297 start_codon:yes stop_codon:yes gene_type:complete
MSEKSEYALSGFYCGDKLETIPSVSHAVIFSEKDLTPIGEATAVFSTDGFDGVYDFPDIYLSFGCCDEKPFKYAAVIEYKTNNILGMIHVYDPEEGVL